jgi:hypothetical protein
MTLYFSIIFLLFSGLYPLSFFSGGLIAFGGIDYGLTFLIAILIPLLFMGSESTDVPYLKKAILLILTVVFIRFVLDGFVQPEIERGPWKIFLMSGSFYLSYFVLQRRLTPANLQSTISAFIFVSSFVSLVNIIQIAFPSLPLSAGGHSFGTSGGELGETYRRFPTTYYHFSTLATVLLVSRLSGSDVVRRKKVGLAVLLLLNLLTVATGGYRANMYALLFTLGLFFISSFRRLRRATRTWFVLAGIPVVFLVYQYSVMRDTDTVFEEGGGKSVGYRFLEAGLGLEKLANTGNWLFGVGYADGFINPFATEEGQSTYYLHNGYVSILYNYGIIGVVAWGVLLISIILFIVRHYRASRGDLLFLILSFQLLGQLIQNFSSGIFNREPSATFAFIFAFCLLEKVATPSGRQPSRAALQDGDST